MLRCCQIARVVTTDGAVRGNMTETFTVREFNFLVGTNRATFPDFHLGGRKRDASGTAELLQIHQKPEGLRTKLTVR